MSFSLLTYSLLSSPFCLFLFFFLSTLSLSGLRLSVPPKPTLSARVIDEKGERVQKFNYTDMLVTEGGRWGGAGEKETEKGRKKNSAPMKRHSPKCN